MLLCGSLAKLQRLYRAAQKSLVRHHCKQLAKAAASAAAAQLDELQQQAAPATVAARAALSRLTGKGVSFQSLGALHSAVAVVQDAVRAAQHGVIPTLPAMEPEQACDTPSEGILREALEDVRGCITDSSTLTLLHEVCDTAHATRYKLFFG
jgi:hypothetical protein